MQAALLKLDGVSKADCTKTTADVTVDRSKFTDAQLMAAVKAAGSGYSATLAKKEK